MIKHIVMMLLLIFITAFAEEKAKAGNKILILFSGWSCKDCFHHLDSALKANGINDHEYVICDQGSKTLYNDNSGLVRAYSKNKSPIITIDSTIKPEKQSRKRPPCYLYEKYRVDITPSVLIIKNGDTAYYAYEKLFGEELRHEYFDSLIAVYKK